MAWATEPAALQALPLCKRKGRRRIEDDAQEDEEEEGRSTMMEATQHCHEDVLCVWMPSYFGGCQELKPVALEL